MPVVWAIVTELDDSMQERLAGVLETRGADAQQRAMRRGFLADLDLPPQSRVLEVGCGTGVLTRLIARLPVAAVVGVDVAPSLLARARDLASGLANVTFEQADGRALPFGDASFDAVVFDSTLSHLPGSEGALSEAFRVLHPRGRLGVFDGDYATTTVALGADDPLQTRVDAMLAGSVHDRWIVRRLPALARAAGFEIERFQSHGFVETEGGYMITIIDRGADILHELGQVGDDTASALKTEARRRVDEGMFFGHIAYGSLVARKPA